MSDNSDNKGRSGQQAAALTTSAGDERSASGKLVVQARMTASGDRNGG